MIQSIGGMSWRTEGARRIAPIIQQAYSDGKIVGAICDATVFLGMNGLLNEKQHTSNTLVSMIYLFDYFCWNSCNNRIVGDILRDNCPSCNNGVVSNRHTRQYR